MKTPLPAFQRGTATGYSPGGSQILTVTAAGAVSTDELVSRLLTATAPFGMMAGESLTEYAQRVARRAGLEIGRWDITGKKARTYRVTLTRT